MYVTLIFSPKSNRTRDYTYHNTSCDFRISLSLEEIDLLFPHVYVESAHCFYSYGVSRLYRFLYIIPTIRHQLYCMRNLPFIW